jgi:ATP adenylyltransferase
MERMFRQRMEYLRSAPPEVCFLCAQAETDDLEGTFVLLRNEICLVVLNRFPYNTGHLLVAPLRHVGELGELSKPELAEVMALTLRGIDALKASMDPEGFNVGANLGTAAGAGVPGHLHMHVVPRWAGDTNFMPVLAETKVLPEDLAQTYQRLKPHFEEL